MGNHTLYYFGDDKVFFEGLRTILHQQSQGSITVKKFFATQESVIQSLFSEVVLASPDAVLIDFSLFSEDYLHLARILARTPLEKNIPIIGILDHLKTSHVLTEAQATGVSLCFIKSEHAKDIAHTLCRLVYPGKMPEPNYVKVKINETWTTGLVSKIGYLYESGLHFETNYELKAGDRVYLEHFWRNKSLIPSKEIVIKKVEKRNLVYNYNFAVDAEFEFIDTFKTPERTPEEEVKRYHQVEDAKYRFNKAFLKNFSASQPKRAKVQIIDSEFLIYKDNKRTDRFPFMLRCLGSDINIENELDKFTPHIIVFSLDDVINEETVKRVALWAKKQSFTPYLIIFKASQGVLEWQTRLSYQQILASSEEMNMEILLKMAHVFDSKIKNIEADHSKKIFLSKHKQESNCEIEIEIKVLQLSESDITFTTTHKIPLGSNLIINAPIKTLAYVKTEQENNGQIHYQAILHSHDELEKNSIRRYLNTVLFRENEVQVTDKKTFVEKDDKLQEILKKSQLKSED